MDLHCVICVDEFDLKDRAPVVLPCGHTYICKVCAGKIKICHECREPLFWHPPRPQQQPQHRSPATGRYSRYNNAHSHGQYNNSRYSPSTPPQPGAPTKQEEIPLPCPKNVVLMEMIEAKQRQERLVAEQKALQDQKRAERLAEKERRKAERKEERERERQRQQLGLLRRADTTPGSCRPGTTTSSASAFSSVSADLQEIEVDIGVDCERERECEPSSSNNNHQDSNDNDNGNDNDEMSNFSDYDDEISSSSSAALPLGDPELISGYAALSGTCGTYAVREPEGLVVLPRDPTRPKYGQQNENRTANSNSNSKQPLYPGDETKDDYDDIQQRFSELFVHEDSNDEGFDGNSNSKYQNQNHYNEYDYDYDDEHEHEHEYDGGGTDRTRTRGRREPFTIDEGQKVQVVGVLESNEQGVYQLARGAGYVVATNKQLVKVGGPLETSCKLEGMLQSVVGKQQELEKNLDEITSLSMALRKEIILEQEKPEEVPVITPSTKKKSKSATTSGGHGTDREVPNAPTDESNCTGQHPTTPTKGFTTQHFPESPGWKGGILSVSSVDSTSVQLGADPRTPCQSSNNAHRHPNAHANANANAHNPYVDEHPLASAYERQQQNHYAYSPAHSCPMPTNHIATTAPNLDQPFLDDESYGNGVLRYRVNNDDELSGMGWAGVLGCGSSLFGERVVQQPSSQRGGDSAAATNIFHSSANGFGFSLDETANLIQNSNVQRLPAALAQAAVGSAHQQHHHHQHMLRTIEGSGSLDSPLRRGGSFDGGGGGGVNFRGGYSNHGGLGRTRRNRNVPSDPQGAHHHHHHHNQNHNYHHNNHHHTNGNNSDPHHHQEPRRQLMMSQMSQHRGVGVASIQRRGSNHGGADLVQTTSR